MKFLKNRFVSIFIFTAIVWLIVLSCRKEAEVESGESYGLRWFLNVHESPKPWLRVDGRVFRNLRGISPYFIEVPKMDAIFFVTFDGLNSDYCYRFFLRKNKKLISIPADKYRGLGMGIGMPIGTYMVDWVDFVEWPKVIIKSKLEDGLDTYEFDLEKETVNDLNQ